MSVRLHQPPASLLPQQGRSMIEMLCVLSIVAILSLGGIRYTGKVFTEYKQIKIAEEYAWLVQDVVENFHSYRIPKDVRNISYYITHTTMVPSGWKYQQGYLRNQMGQVLFLWDGERLQINFEMGRKQGMTPGLKGMCRILFNNVLRPYSSRIYLAANYWGNDHLELFFGDKYCKAENRKCLSDITFAEIEEQCNLCLGEEGEFRTNCAVVMFFEM